MASFLPRHTHLSLDPEFLSTFEVLLNHAVAQVTGRPDDMARLREEVTAFVATAKGDPVCHPHLLQILERILENPYGLGSITPNR